MILSMALSTVPDPFSYRVPSIESTVVYKLKDWTFVANIFYFTHFFIIADFDENQGTCSKRKTLSQIAVHHQTTLTVAGSYVHTKLMPKTMFSADE